MTSPPPIPSHHEKWRAVSPEPGFLFIGEIEIVNAALAAQIREVSAAYDNWLVALDPIPDDRRGIAPAPLPYWDALRKSLQVASFGIRLGATHQGFAAAQMATEDDALAVAALARWLPGLLQSRSDFAGFVEAADNIETRRHGTTVELTFDLNGDKIPKRSPY